MSLSHPRPAFAFLANILGQLEAAGTPYFEGFIAMANVRGQLETAGTNYFDSFVAIPGTRAHIRSVSGFMPALVATATYVESENTEIVLGEHSQFESVLEMVITLGALHMAREGGRATLGFGRFIFHTEDEAYQHLRDRTFFGRGQLVMGSTRYGT
ncbi:hypothetical protein N7455_006843 [Penicillium solitum]|uniref:uncharacterized protein n=1 Tax=Penicillium solitum TaxID=60172 RepID=UPI0032C4857D|nr:hypothetical protein N7455_006843 [Penicillium solitum]